MEIQLQSGASEIFNPLSYSTLTGSTILFPDRVFICQQNPCWFFLGEGCSA